MICGTGGSCFQPHGTPACDDSTCCQAVCDVDLFCCCIEWDQNCVDTALQLCGEAYHVVTAGGEIDDPENTVIDGFTIRDGWANGSSNLDRHHGGGMLIEGDASVIRCTVTQNTATYKGGGMSITGDIQPWIINCTFKENPGDPANPGDKQVFPEIGGGLANSDLAVTIVTNSLFVGNEATGNGGGIFTGAGTCTPDACAHITLINCTVVSNTADADNDGVGAGGGLYAGGNFGIVTADNGIFWDNLPDQINGQPAAVFEINYSDCAGGCPGMGTGNINADPLFVNTPGNLRLSLGSPAIDKGNPNELIIPCDFFNLDNDGDTCAPAPEEATPDLDLINRVLDGDDNGTDLVDMGAYEFIHPNSCPWDFNGDGMVGAFDLLTLLVAWGPCADCNDCPADFDGNCTVGATDLLALLVNWGPCPAFSVEPPSLEEELADACLTQEDWDEFEDVMTDPNASQADKDRYLCWMIHYLFHCNKCNCSHPSECPSPDPFN